MTQWTDINQMIAEMVRDGYEPGAIIGSPVQIKRLLVQPAPHGDLYAGETVLSGWEYQGLPIARCYEVSGPCVVSREVYRALQKCGRTDFVGLPGDVLAENLSPMPTRNPILF